MLDIPDSAWMTKMLEPPVGIADMVLDTDTFNEVDDQFALAYALLSPERLKVRAVFAAPFYCNKPGLMVNRRSVSPEDGMEKSHAEILRILRVMGISPEGFVYRGSTSFLPDEATPVDSPAARRLVELSREYTSDHPLYIVAIGAITNVASALLMEPELARRAVVVWLGGHSGYMERTVEFNLVQDVPAVRTVLDSGVPLVRVPCRNVASHMLASVADMNAWLRGHNALADLLADTFCAYTNEPFAWAKEIWDVAAVAWLTHPEWEPSALWHTPHLTDDYRWVHDDSRHLCREVQSVCRNPIMKDLFSRINGFGSRPENAE